MLIFAISIGADKYSYWSENNPMLVQDLKSALSVDVSDWTKYYRKVRLFNVKQFLDTWQDLYKTCTLTRYAMKEYIMLVTAVKYPVLKMYVF